MELINLLLEVFGLVFPSAIVYAAQRFFPIGPLGSLLPVSVTAEQQVFVLCAIPSLVYLIGRLYFAIIFKITNKLFHKSDSDTTVSIVGTTLGALGEFLSSHLCTSPLMWSQITYHLSITRITGVLCTDLCRFRGPALPPAHS
jgi:hypothetical protein